MESTVNGQMSQSQPKGQSTVNGSTSLCGLVMLSSCWALRRAASAPLPRLCSYTIIRTQHPQHHTHWHKHSRLLALPRWTTTTFSVAQFSSKRSRWGDKQETEEQKQEEEEEEEEEEDEDEGQETGELEEGFEEDEDEGQEAGELEEGFEEGEEEGDKASEKDASEFSRDNEGNPSDFEDENAMWDEFLRIMGFEQPTSEEYADLVVDVVNETNDTIRELKNEFRDQILPAYRRKKKKQAFLLKMHKLHRQRKREKRAALRAKYGAPPVHMPPHHHDGFGDYFPHILNNLPADFPKEHIPILKDAARVVAMNGSWPEFEKHNMIHEMIKTLSMTPEEAQYWRKLAYEFPPLRTPLYEYVDFEKHPEDDRVTMDDGYEYEEVPDEENEEQLDQQEEEAGDESEQPSRRKRTET